ncbi:MAG: prepilin-type N-terminal cleavage/methylation domain-containing protein [Planctomycetota bacterium]
MKNTQTPKSNGFTLIELLVVIAIISLLGTLMITTFISAKRDSEEFKVKAFIQTIGASLEVYQSDRRNGVYPPSSLEGFPALGTKLPNKTNLGIEAMVVCLSSPNFGGLKDSETIESLLDNVDEDSSSRKMTKWGSNELFELTDTWGNPLVYFNAQDYENRNVRAYSRTEPDVLDYEVVSVKPWMNPKTKSPYNSSTYQLFSAGPDGIFNTDDDIGNWSSK